MKVSELAAQQINAATNQQTWGTITYNIKSYGALGDGATDDTAAIQAAIDAAYAAGGGTVVIPGSGTFVFTSIQVKSGVTLKSKGGTLKLKNSTCTNAATSYYLVHNLNGSSAWDNVTLDGLIINGNKVNNATFLVADGITAVGENVVVKNCRIYDPPDSGIMFSGAKNSLCVDNRIKDGRDLGIYVNDGDGTGHYENIISRNRITGFPFGGIGLKRICQRTIVSNNTIYDCGNGITLEQASTATDYSKNVSIVNNRLRRIGYIEATAAKVGINLRASDYTLVANNRIEDCERNNILVEGSSYCSITGNVISCEVTASATNNEGIYLTMRDALGCDYNIIEGNIITNPRHRGIWLSGTGQNNVLSQNIVKGAGDDALRVEAGWDNNIISENVLSGLYDIEYFAGALNRLVNNIYVNNSIAGNIQNYESTRIKLGAYTLWVDSTGDVRIINGTPATDTDGTIVGTQT